MDIFRVVGVGLIGAVISLFLKESKPEFVIFCVMATGIVLLILILNALSQVIESFSAIVEQTNIDQSLFAGILKIIGIGYVTEYAAEVCKDMNCGSIANKIQLAGKVVIFLMALPVMVSFVEMIARLA